MEEELRTQKIKYEEANEDVYRRMMDIKDSEGEHVNDLEAFLDAQLEYHERSREVLLQLRKEWPSRYVGSTHGEKLKDTDEWASQSASYPPNGRRAGRPRSNTAHSYQERYEPVQEELVNAMESRPIIRSNRETSPVYSVDPTPQRPIAVRTSTFEGPMQLRQEQAWPSRTVSENYGPPRPVSRVVTDPYMDPPDSAGQYRSNGGSPDRSYYGRSISPTPSYGDAMSRRTSSNTLNGATLAKKAPPPPPPSRAKKPPPPPPMKRPILSATEV